IGGLAGMAHGSARATLDVAIVYRRSRANHERLVAVFEPYSPYLRGAPPGLPFRFDGQTLASGLNFTLTTIIGDIDVLGEVPGNGTWEALIHDSEIMTIFGIETRVVSLPRLIQLKRAA
ncbi:MAG TPA: hypothetical protein PKA83_17560, partial [Pirellulaceae bacterium]|nr:hypothetical protein [Pirellulaceae bacterium]